MEMNIGETDADGWTYVSWIDAANSYALKTHETELSVSGGRFIPCDGFFDRGSYKYRIREKARTITVTALPMPLSAVRGVVTARIILDYEKEDQSEKALNIIRAAMEAQP
jgi:hypothetical protein